MTKKKIKGLIPAFLLYFNTIKFLTLKQIFYRFFKSFSRLKSPKLHNLFLNKATKNFILINPNSSKINDEQTFSFMKISTDLNNNDLWNENNHPKLWNYNLNYFDFLLSNQVSNQNGLPEKLVNSWIDKNINFLRSAWDPYPISLRTVNWIKWLVYFDLDPPKKIKNNLILQADYLYKNLEYHLGGNHLISNAKALIFLGILFSGKKARIWYEKGIELLKSQLDTQILQDGSHYELSPMYHSIILEDLLDIKNIHQAFSLEDDIFDEGLIKKMIFWLQAMTHPDGSLSHFNDSTNDECLNCHQLIDYAKRMGVKTSENNKQILDFDDSGYTVYSDEDIYLISDRGNIGPDELPGHAHADTLSFELSLFKKKLIVNLGISTYETNKTRILERSSTNHSCLIINDLNSSQVWSSFRVGNRAKILTKENNFSNQEIEFSASHNGYSNLPGSPVHRRKWSICNNQITIIDNVLSGKQNILKLCFPLHPNVKINKVSEDNIFLQLADKEIVISFIYSGLDNKKIKIEDSIYNYSFDSQEETKKIVFEAEAKSTSEIKSIFKW
ncbi:heparinase II/III family protein [SAR86 cluster bacterium]|nr:heparinase II/III family protein [SAR86 cluster bacterium]